LACIIKHDILTLLGDFLNPNGVYEDLTDFTLVKKYMEEQLEDYNMTPGVVSMDLVLFKDAIEHGMRCTDCCIG